MDIVVKVEQLTKKYGPFSALDRCDLSVNRGTIFGLLGPNGAGKTTLIRCLLGFVAPTSGQAQLDGLDCRTQSVLVRRQVAYLPAEARLFRMMRGDVVLDFFSRIHPGGSLERSKSIASRLSLDLSRRVAFMSTGMRQKLAIACVLACRTRLLILDEPTANLDPSVRAEVMTLIREAQHDGSTVLFSSHIFSEIEELCGTAAIMRNGRVMQTINIEQLRSTHRVSAIPSTGASICITGNIVGEISLIENSEKRFEVDILGPLEEYLPWISSLPLKNLRIEPTGLKNIYESCCEYS